MLSHARNVPLFVTLWTVARQAPLSIGFSRQESWSGLPCPPPGDLPDHGIQSKSLALAGGFFTTSTTWEAPYQAGVMGQKPISFLSKAAHLSLTEGRSLTLRNPFLLTVPNGKPSLSASFPSCFSEPGLCPAQVGSYLFSSPGMWTRSEEGESRRGRPWTSHTARSSKCD